MSRLSVLATFLDPAQGMQVEATTDGGARVVFDSPPPGEESAGASPRETVLAALAACTAMDVASILRKKRQPASGYQIAVSGEARDDEHPHVFTTIVVEHRVSGMVEVQALARAIELSATRYCPVSAMLSAGLPIEHRYRLATPDGEEHSGLAARTGPELA